MGSNIDPHSSIDNAIKSLTDEITIIINLKQSAIIPTEPIGIKGQAQFLNTVISVETELIKNDFINYLKTKEVQLGRKPSSYGYNDRIIDMDLLVWNNEIIDNHLFTRPYLKKLVLSIQPTFQASHKIVFSASNPQFFSEAKKLGKQVFLPAVPYNNEKLAKYDVIILVDDKILSLQLNQTKKSSPISIDLVSNLQHYQNKTSNLNSLPIVKALGNSQKNRTLLDATCGMGKDTSLFLSRGFKVTALENSPIMAKLFENAISRCQQDTNFAKLIKNNLKFKHADAFDTLASLQYSTNKPDIIYLDPMFLEKKKSALSKKEMQILQYILPATTYTEQKKLLSLALKAAQKRDIIKQPKNAPVLIEGVAHQYKGRAVRYDLYIV